MKPPPGPFRPAFWRSPLRGPWLTSALGTILGVLMLVVLVTGFLSHVAYQPDLPGNAIVPAGGDPALLLRRVRELLAPDGTAVIELDPPGRPTERTRVRLEAPGLVSEWFPWARAGVDGIGVLAEAAGLCPAPARRAGDRWYAHLCRR